LRKACVLLDDILTRPIQSLAQPVCPIGLHVEEIFE